MLFIAFMNNVQNLYQIAPVYDARPGIAGAQLTAEISSELVD